MSNEQNRDRMPPGQQLVAPGKWPVIGERQPAHLDEPWTLTVEGAVTTPMTWTLSELQGLPQTATELDIHCVTRWSKLDNRFEGILLADLLALVQPSDQAKYISFVARSTRSHSTSLTLHDALHQQTLIALKYDDQPLEIGHGGPIRNIVPGRYFYKSVKWLEKIELLTEDRLGMWEAESGYHNHADPWKEERYMAASIDKREAALLIQSKDFSGQELRGIDASDRDLSQLNAEGALLRDGHFENARLQAANFRDANLSNSHFAGADLRGASFVNADVEGADFSGADLRGADFSGASMIGASFTTQINSTTVAANVDASTLVPEDVMAPLFPEQLAFIKAALKNPSV